jgi:ADP-ribose pyrophosphatase YjhB (NUDIX family)
MGKPGVFNVAVAAIIEKDDLILLTKRSPLRDYEPNVWEAGITGRVDQGESCEDAVLREVREETNLTVEIIAPFATFHFFRGEERIEYIGVNFWCAYSSGEVTLQIEEQVEYLWVTPEKALTIIERPEIITELKAFITFKHRYQS